MISQIDGFGAPQTSSRRPPETPISRDSHRKAMWFTIGIEKRFADLAVSQVVEIDSIRESWHTDFCQIWWFRRSGSELTHKNRRCPDIHDFFGLKKKKVPTPWIPYTFFDSFSKIVKNYIGISRGRYLFLFRTKKVHECRGHVKSPQIFFITFIVQSLDLSILDHFLTIFYTVLLPIPLHSLYSVVGLAKIHLQGWR